MTATLVYPVPEGDFGKYLIGAWKRTLECREFGKSYEHQRTFNKIVVIEPAVGTAAEPGTSVSMVVYTQVAHLFGLDWAHSAVS